MDTKKVKLNTIDLKWYINPHTHEILDSENLDPMWINSTHYEIGLDTNKLLNLVNMKIIQYESMMEGADYEDFIKSEYAAGAMMQLLSEMLSIEIEVKHDS